MVHGSFQSVDRCHPPDYGLFESSDKEATPVRVPVKSENDAFRLVFGGAVVIFASLILGAVTTPVAGIALFAGILAGVTGWELLTKDPEAPRPLSEALERGRQVGGARKHRVLVIANQTVNGDELREELMRRGTSEVELRVVVPVLPSRAHYVASDIDRELAEARTRLEPALAWAAAQGFDVAGRVGDTSPLVAIEDELRDGGVDELIISTHPAARSNWLESGLVERARAELDIPVTHVVVDLERQQVA
jgi:hypothetical protein